MPPARTRASTTRTNNTFLRGQQRSDKDGKVEFKTIYPGWYMGRTPHIHCKVHVNGSTVHTGQFFFDESVSAKVYSKGVYASRGTQDTTNAEDGIFAGSQGRSTLKVSRRRNKKGKKVDGYLGKLEPRRHPALTLAPPAFFRPRRGGGVAFSLF